MEDLTILGAARTGAVPDQDEQLAVGARTDNASFGLLYERHALAVFRYLRARGAGEDQAEELTAVAFERALSRIDSFRPGRSGFRAWLLTIVRNAWVDGHRRSARDTGLAAAEALPAVGPSPEAMAIAAEERELVMRLVARLPEPAQDALALRYAAGLTSREIAHVIGKSDDATKKLLSRSLASLREAARHDR